MRARNFLSANLICVIFLVDVAACSAASDNLPYVDPDVTQFRFSSQSNANGTFCDLIMSVVKVPNTLSHNAVVWRKPDGKTIVVGFETEFTESTIEHGIPSVPSILPIKNVAVKSELFHSEGMIDRLSGDALYSVRQDGVTSFLQTMQRGFYYLEISLADDRRFSYVIRDDTTRKAAASEWLKCISRLSR
jgi:hypothetical protein